MPNINDELRKQRQESILNAFSGEQSSSPIPFSTNTNLLDIAIDTDASVSSFDEDTYNKFIKEDSYISSRKTVKDIEQLKGENQSGLSKLVNGVGKGLINEVIIGIPMAISDMIDLGINMFRDASEQDYTNPLTEQLVAAQEAVNEKLKVYRKNPNKAFDFGDWGWYTDNISTVFSTLSLMIPSTGVMKGLSYGSKLLKADKLAKVTLRAAKVKKYGKHAKSFNNFVSVGTAAATNRMLENYREAREVYRENYDSTLSRLNEMSDKDKKQFIYNNPNFANKSNKEIAHMIANDGARDTYWNDMGLILLDFLQYKALNNIFKGFAIKNSNADIRAAQEIAINELSNTTTDYVKRLGIKVKPNTFLYNRLDNLQYNLKHPLKALGSIEFSEGLEEGWQGIQTERGKEAVEIAFDPEYSRRSVESYLTDPMIWEQAFWGVIGGKIFKRAGSGLGYLQTKINANIKKHKGELTDAQYDNIILGENKSRLAEINNRKKLMDSFINGINTINNGKNLYETNLETKEFKDITSNEEKQQLINRLTSDFITEFTLNAAQTGNYELLKDFISNPEFSKYFEKTNLNSILKVNQDISTFIKEKMDEVYNDYENNFINVSDNVDGDNLYIIEAVARYMTSTKNNINIQQDYINSLYRNIQQNPDYETITIKDKERIKIQTAKAIYDIYQKQLEDLEKNKNIFKSNTETTRQELIEDLKIISKYLNNNDIFNIEDTNAKKIIDKFYDFAEQITGIKDRKDFSLNSVFETQLSDIYSREILNEINKSKIPNNREQYEKIYNEYSTLLDNKVIKRYDKASEKIIEYLKNSEDPNVAYRNIIEEKADTYDKSIKDAIDIIKLANKTSELFVRSLRQEVDKIINERNEERETARRGTNDNVEITENKTNEIRQEIEQEENEAIEDKPETESNNESNENTLSEVERKAADEFIEEAENEQKSDDNPSTGGLPVGPEVIEYVDEDGNSHIIDNTLYEEEQRISPEEQKYLEDQARAYNEQIEINPEEWFVEVIRSKFKELYSNEDTRNIVLDAVNNGIDSEAYKTLYDILKESVIYELNVNEAQADGYTTRGFKLILNGFIRTTKITDEIRNNVRALIDNLSTKIKFNQNNSEITTVSDADWVDNFYQLIRNIYGDNFIPGPDGKYHIGVANIFNYLLNQSKENKLSIDEIRAIHYNFREILKKDLFKDDDIVFDNIKDFDIATNQFFENLIKINTTKQTVSDNVHVAISKSIRNNIMKNLGNYVNKKLRFERTKNSISIKIGNVEVGFLSTVQRIDGNTKYVKYVNKKIEENYKLVQNVWKNGDRYETNLDGIINEIINAESEEAAFVFNLMYRRYLKDKTKNPNIEAINEEELTKFYNTRIIQDFINDSDMYIPGSRSNQVDPEYYKKLDALNALKNIIFYQVPGDISIIDNKQSLKDSYETYKAKLYKNYEITYDIQERINNKINDNAIIESEIVAVSNNKLIIDEDANNNIGDLNLNSENNPIVIVDKDGNFQIEGYKADGLINGVGFAPGTMGMIINVQNNYPMIAKFVAGAKIKDNNKKLTEALHKEITSILEEYVNTTNINEIDSAFETLKTKLQNLVGYGGNNIFTGFSIYTTNNDTIGIKLGKNGGYNLIIHKYSSAIRRQENGLYKDSKTGEIIDPTSNKINNYKKIELFYRKDGDKKNKLYKTIKKHKKSIEGFAEDFINNVEFNQTFFAFANKTLSNVKGPYLSKKDNKYVLKVGDYVSEYDSFHELVMKNKAFKTTQGTNKYGGFYNLDNSAVDFYMTYKLVNAPTKSKAERIKEYENELKDKQQVNIRDILSLEGHSDEAIDVIMSAKDFMPTELFYTNSYENPEAKGFVNEENKPFITNKGLEAAIANKTSLLQLMLHEHIHTLINSNNFFEGEIGQERLDGLYETYKQAAEAAKQNLNPNDFNSIKLFNWFNDFATINDNKGKLYLMQEWLTETLTDKGLQQFLNNTIYKETTIAKVERAKEKSIFQKILDFLIELFNANGNGINSINENSILEQIYNLTQNSNINNNTNNEVVIEENTDNIAEESHNEITEEIDNSSETIEDDIEIDDDMISLDDMGDISDDFIDLNYSIIEPINNTEEYVIDIFNKSNTKNNVANIINIDNMENFLDKYKPENRSKIVSNLTAMNINWQCQ